MRAPRETAEPFLLLLPKIGEILEAVETRQPEGTLRSREETLDFVKSEYSLGAEN